MAGFKLYIVIAQRDSMQVVVGLAAEDDDVDEETMTGNVQHGGGYQPD
ncbi:uncharacterized protein AB675_320 [Cyphellophora attinorum]|uniref:Uncharacterized protein n=1 Tax=Cyphellophora attinorum TaxID=1664694 RepID=A0A0N1HHW9_9EURO|nr:uncharacterized protein AB675_320 [Phialophora attinorum]KPI45724.1 hypothetical protein AB675_320 [Phialophora attinorum]